MAKLNKTPLQIRAKRGTEAQITETSPVPYQLEGEIAYATDTKEFYVSDGTNFVLSGESTFAKLDGTNQPFTGDLEISKTSPILKQTDTTTGNVFTQTLGANQNFDLDSGDFVFSGGNLGIGTTTPNANAILDVTSTTKAFMPPRMTTTQRDAIASPTAGMVIYNSTTNVLNFHNGTSWGAV